MEKETKDTRIELTLEMVGEMMKAEIKAYAQMYVIMFCFYAFVGWLVHYAVCEMLVRGGPYTFEVLPWLYPAIVCICSAFPAFFAVRSIYYVVSRLQMVRRGEFVIVKDTLSSIGEREYNFDYYRFFVQCDMSKYVNSLYFKQYGRYIMGGDGYRHSIKGILNSSFPGDTFYVAVYKTSPETLAFVFNAKMYSWAEDEKETDSGPEEEMEESDV